MNGTKEEFFHNQDHVFQYVEEVQQAEEADACLIKEASYITTHTASANDKKPAISLAPQELTHASEIILATDHNGSTNLEESIKRGARPLELSGTMKRPETSKRKASEVVVSTPEESAHITKRITSIQLPAALILPRHTPKIPERIPKLFADLVFYFIPNSRTNVARRTRMNKVEQLGGLILPRFDAGRITHIIVDNGINANIVLKHIDKAAIPDHIMILNERWTPDCVIFSRILESTDQYWVSGFEDRDSETPKLREEKVNSVEDIAVEETGSLIIKDMKPRLPIRESNTVESSGSSLVGSTISPTIAFAVQNTVAIRIPDTPQAVDELEITMATVRMLGDVQLEEEPQASPEEVAKRRVKTHNLQGQEHFRCMKPHTVGDSNPSGPNDFVISKLQTMLSYYETSRNPDDKWRTRGYRLAIASLTRQEQPIQTMSQALRLPSVGSRLAAHIVEIVKTGTMERTECLGDDYALVQKFMGVYGVGPFTAHELIQRGFRSLNDLLQGNVLNRNQRIGVELYDDLNTRIPRDEVRAHKQIVLKQASKIDQTLQVHVMGSYRRGAQDCGDIDFMITRKDTSKQDLVRTWQKLLFVLESEKRYLTHALIVSDRTDGLKWQGICKLPDVGTRHRRVDFLLVPWHQRGAALLYFTGSDLFNRSMRLLARRKGYTLNEKGLIKGAFMTREGVKMTQGENTGAETEQEIFEILGVPYRRPEQRCVT